MLWILVSLSCIYLLVNVHAQGKAPIIVKPPQSVIAAKGGTTDLICQATGSPTLHYEWFHNGKSIQSTSRRSITKVGNLYFSRVLHKRNKVSDTGSYYCIVSNAYGQDQSKPVNLTLGFLRSTFRKQPLDQSVSLGNRVVLTCTPPRGKPKPQVNWLKDKQRVLSSDRILLENKNQKLVIKNFQEDDVGTYVCAATNVAGRRLSNSVVVARSAPPVLIEDPKDAIVQIGTGQVSFSCKAKGNPAPSIVWKKEGNDTVLQSTDGKLTLTKLKARHDGTYTCLAQNSEGSVSAQARLTVNYPPEFIVVPPDAHKMVGKTLKLMCLANSRPDPRIRWRNKGTGQYYNIGQWYGNIHIEQNDRTVSLIISPLQTKDAGTYTCTADNGLAKIEHDVKVLVHNRSEYAPNFTIDRSSETADVNSNTTLICDVDGNPKPTVKWFKVGEYHGLRDDIILRDYPLGKKHRYVLNIVRVRESNAGTFQCQAVNKINTATKNVDLKVTSKLHLAESIGVGVPAMPTDVKVSDWTEHQALIRWNPGQGGSQYRILAYAIGYINIDERSMEKYASFSVKRNRYVVTNLQPNTRYRFFVRGINRNGRGPPSLLSDVIITKIATTTIPVLPTTAGVKKDISFRKVQLNISVRGGDPGKLIVRWQEFKEAQIIDGYHIYWKYEGGGKDFQRETLRDNRANHYILSNLQNYTTYIVKVVIFKQAFQGVMSDIAYSKTTNEAIPLSTKVFQNDSDSIVVTWVQLWKKNSGEDEVKNYTIWYVPVDDPEERQHIIIAAKDERYHFIIGALDTGVKYKVWMTASTANKHRYNSKEELITLSSDVREKELSKGLLQNIKEFVLRPWFLGVLGGVFLILIVLILIYCHCKRSSAKKDVDNFPIQLQDRNPPESIRKPSESRNIESDIMTPISRGRERVSECENLEGRPTRMYRTSGSPNTPTRAGFDFPEITITPNKYERMYRSPEAGRGTDKEVRNGRQPRQVPEDVFESPSRMKSRTRNPYSPNPKSINIGGESRNDFDNAKPKKNHDPKSDGLGSRSYPGDAPPDYETAIAENIAVGQSQNYDRNERPSNDVDDNPRLSYKSERYGNPSSRQSSCSPGSECSNQGSSVAGRRKGLKPLPRLTIASVNWADMLPPPPSHPPPSSVATRSPPPSPTATSMCSETTYGRSHASSFFPRRSGSVVSGDLERATTDSVVSGKSKGKSENKLPFDLAGITSDIIMQWADSVTNTSGSDNDSPCSSPSRVSGISSDGSFLTDTDFANAVKAAAECGGFNIDIDLNMYKDMDPISFQPFAGSLSTYNPESGENPNKDSKPTSKKPNNGCKDVEGMRDASSRPARARRSRTTPLENTSPARPSNSSTKETSPLISSNQDPKSNRKPKKPNEVSADGSAGYVPALTRTSALGKLEPVNRGPVKKKYAVVKTLPQVQAKDTAEYPANYPSHSLSSSTSNASTIRSSSCPPVNISDDELEDYVL